MIILLVGIPFVSAALAFLLRRNDVRRGTILFTAIVHSSLTFLLCFKSAETLGKWLFLDGLGKLFLCITSLLFLSAAVYTIAFLKDELKNTCHPARNGSTIFHTSEAVFSGCLLLFLGTMTLVVISRNFGLLWVAIEATTLVSAPLIYFHHNRRSLEATWKYLLICSVGIALALLGNLFLAVAVSFSGQHETALVVSQIDISGVEGGIPWLKAAFLLMIVGYGTKMGLAPMHTWLPDAHSEAPSVVSALLSGALLNCAFLGILRIHQVCVVSGIASFSKDILVVFGLLSMLVAAVFIFGQRDYKRMLAYSSVEHMGILALGVGIGQTATFGALFHVFNHSIVKGLLFFVAGNILAVYHTKETKSVRGMMKIIPFSGALWMAGILAIAGSPPFSVFVSEFAVLKGALDQGRNVIAIAYMILLAAVFIGMFTIIPQMVQGDPSDRMKHGKVKESILKILPGAVLCGLALWIGVHMPAGLRDLIDQAVRIVEGSL